jgi:hypothetical protein
VARLPAQNHDLSPEATKMPFSMVILTLFTCGGPPSPMCARRCNDCTPRCVSSGAFVSSTDKVCDEECNIDNDTWFCEVYDGECLAMMAGEG